MLCIEHSWHSRTVFGWRKQTQKPKFEVNDSSGGGRNSFHVQQNRSGTRPIFPPALNDNSNFRGADYAVICLRPPPCCRVSSSPRFFVLCQQRRDLPLRSSLSRHRRRNSKRTTTLSSQASRADTEGSSGWGRCYYAVNAPFSIPTICSHIEVGFGFRPNSVNF